VTFVVAGTRTKETNVETGGIVNGSGHRGRKRRGRAFGPNVSAIRTENQGKKCRPPRLVSKMIESGRFGQKFKLEWDGFGE